jgi:plastocyanin
MRILRGRHPTIAMRTKAAPFRAALMATRVAVAAALCAAGPSLAATVEIKLIQTPAGQTYFEPAGVHIAAGDTIRWIQVAGFHSITAYHPSNDNHELRIPTSAKPWDSGVLLGTYPASGSTFEHVFTVQGVYDYFCRPHEMAGMVGRIVVGDPGDGPGTKPFGYAPNEHWTSVPEVARKALPSVDEILKKGTVSVR